VRLLVKIIPLSAGTAEPAGAPELRLCPPDVEPDTILSFLAGKFGDPVETAWTSTERHPRIETGWIFRSPHKGEPDRDVEILCVPFVEVDGSLRPMYEHLADRRQEFEELASRGVFDRYTVIELPQRDYRAAQASPDPAPQPGHDERDMV